MGFWGFGTPKMDLLAFLLLLVLSRQGMRHEPEVKTIRVRLGFFSSGIPRFIPWHP